jgi:hypothetical protein
MKCQTHRRWSKAGARARAARGGLLASQVSLTSVVWLKSLAWLISLAMLVSTASAHAEQAGQADQQPTLRAGTARANISPKKPRILVMGRMSEGTNHDIFARALVLNDGRQRLVLVTYDLNCLDVATPILRKRCRDELGIPAGNLVLMGTHNHAAPIQIVPSNFDYGRWLADRMFQMIQEAIADEQDGARVRFGFGPGYFVRSVGNAPVDFEIQLLRVDVGDKPLALLFNHPTHPLQVSQTRIGVGHPGYAVDEIEAQLPGVTAMYGDACGGNQFPTRGRIMFGSLEEVQAQGHDLSQAVLRIAGRELQDVTGPLGSTLEVISLPLAEPVSYEEALKLAVDVPRDVGIVPYPHPDRETNWIRMLLKYHEEKTPFPKRTDELVCTDDAFLVRSYAKPREFPCRYEEVIVSRIGELSLVAMQGEVCAPIGMRIKDALRRQGPTFVTAYMGEHNLYIPTRELVRMDAYQAKVIRIQYASPVGWAPEVEDEMVDAVVKIAKEFKQKSSE